NRRYSRLPVGATRSPVPSVFQNHASCGGCPTGLNELLDSPRVLRYVPPPCLNRFSRELTPPHRGRPSCGGFFDVASAQRRLTELESLMASETFWNNRDQAQKLIDETSTLRKKIDPLVASEKQLEALRVMTELA